MGQPIREAGGASGWREVILFLIREVWEAGGEGKNSREARGAPLVSPACCCEYDSGKTMSSIETKKGDLKKIKLSLNCIVLSYLILFYLIYLIDYMFALVITWS